MILLIGMYNKSQCLAKRSTMKRVEVLLRNMTEVILNLPKHNNRKFTSMITSTLTSTIKSTIKSILTSTLTSTIKSTTTAHITSQNQLLCQSITNQEILLSKNMTKHTDICHLHHQIFMKYLSC